MDNQYEEEINLVTLLFKVCQRWRALLIVAIAAAVSVGGTKLAINIQGLSDEESVAELEAAYLDLVGSYEAEGENLERRIESNQRNLELQSDYNDKSILMKIDPQNEWVGSMNLYIDTDYQIIPGNSVQNENPAYKITYAYYDYYAGGFYVDVMERLSFDVGELKYLREVLSVGVDANRYSITITSVADTKEHCEELLRVASESLQSRYSFVAASLGEHTLTMSDIISNAQINANREQYQIEQRNKEKDWMQNEYQLNNEYREWKKREDDIKSQYPVIDLTAAVKNGIKWIVVAGAGGGFLGCVVLFIKYMFSGRMKSAEDLGGGVCVLAELPVRGKKKNAIDRLVYRMFGIVNRELEYDSRVEAMALALEKMLSARQCEKATIAFVGDVKETELRAFVKQIGNILSARYKAVPAGDIIAEPAAAKTAYESDAVVLVAEQDVTMKKKYAQVRSQLAACKVEVLGAVLFGAESL